MRLLFQNADGIAGSQLSDAFKVLVYPGHDPQECTLAGTIAAQHANLRAGIEREPNILENFALTDFLGQAFHLKYVLLCHDIEDTGYGVQRAGEKTLNPVARRRSGGVTSDELITWSDCAPIVRIAMSELFRGEPVTSRWSKHVVSQTTFIARTAKLHSKRVP